MQGDGGRAAEHQEGVLNTWIMWMKSTVSLMEKPAAASSSLWQQQHLLLLYRENMLIKHLSISQYNTFMCNEVMVFAQSNVISLMNEQYSLFHFRKHSQRNWKHITQKYLVFSIRKLQHLYWTFFTFSRLCVQKSHSRHCVYFWRSIGYRKLKKISVQQSGEPLLGCCWKAA